MHTSLKALFVLALALLAATVSAAGVDPWEPKLDSRGRVVLDWDDLIPADYDPQASLDQIAAKYDIDNMEDDDPRVEAIQAEVRALFDQAPGVASLDGREVRLPGLVLPLEGDAQRMREFLLVPYFGACIHVPPPPANQIVYVRTQPEGVERREFYAAVWVEGTLHLEHQSNDTGDASYTLHATRIETYEE